MPEGFGRNFNPLLDKYLKDQETMGIPLQIKKPYKPRLNEELTLATKAESLGYIVAVRAGGTKGIYFVQTTDSEGKEFQVVAENEIGK